MGRLDLHGAIRAVIVVGFPLYCAFVWHLATVPQPPNRDTLTFNGDRYDKIQQAK